MELAAIGDALAQVPLFASLSEADRRALAGRVRSRRFGAGETLFHRGDPAAHLYVLVTGSAKVTLPDEYGKEAVIALLRPGEVFGELALFDDAPRSATIVAVGDTECLLVARDDFLALLERAPQTMREVLRLLARTLRRSTSRVEDLVFLDVPSRVAKSILDLSEVGGAEKEIELTQDDLAAMVGATRVSVNRVLASLESRGIIKVARRRIGVVDRERLAREVRYQ
ncbi:MAG: Crp/Fnr family transcriptional regulator [Chloroflexi bacterium]|nr:MAG: Crp/Fnr family transcriptional regulator [Chloroflexota bacterium]